MSSLKMHVFEIMTTPSIYVKTSNLENKACILAYLVALA
jgi:hypothetical protein